MSRLNSLLTATEENEDAYSADGSNVALVGIQARAAVAGRSARTVLGLRFCNTGKKPIEAIYTFPVPESATLIGLEVEREGKRFVGKVLESEKASRKYEKSLGDGDGGYLLIQERANLFRLMAGNLPAGGEVLVLVTYVETLAEHGGMIDYVLPTAISARYVPPHLAWEKDGRPADAVVNPPKAAEVPYGIEIDLEIRHPNGVKSVSCNRPARIGLGGGPLVRASFSAGTERPDGDIVFSVVPDVPEKASAILAHSDGLGSFLQISWPIPAVRNDTLPSRYFFLVDGSGSMSGERITQARRAVAACVAALRPQDQFAIGCFGNEFRLVSGFTQVGDDTVAAARRQIAAIQADLGGTEMRGALESAYAMFGDTGDGRTGRLVMITDGEVSNEAEIFELVRSRRGTASLFVAAIGEAPNDHLGKGCARAGDGHCVFIRQGEAVEQKMFGLFASTCNLPAEEVSLELPKGWDPLSTDRFPSGQTADLLLRHPREGACGKEITLRWTLGGKIHKLRIPVLELEGKVSPLPQLWARARLQELEGQREGQEEIGRKEATRLASQFGIASAWTSFVLHEVRENKTDTGEMETILVASQPARDEWMNYSVIHSVACCVAAPQPACLGINQPGRMWFAKGKNMLSSLADKFFCQDEHNDKLEGYDLLPDLLALQKARGGFGLEAAELCGIKTGPVLKAWKKAAATLPHGGHWTEQEILATALVLAWLEKQLAGRRGEWEPMLRKTLDAYAALMKKPDSAPLRVGSQPFADWIAAWL